MQTSAPADQQTEVFSAVSAALWDVRERLEDVLFSLVQEQLTVSTGGTRWLPRADRQVRAAMARLQLAEVARAAETGAALAAIGLSAEASLAELADAAPEPWTTVLHDHRVALRSLAFEVESTAAENRRLLDAGATAVREALAGLTGMARRYDGSGHAVHTSPAALLLDEHA